MSDFCFAFTKKKKKRIVRHKVVITFLFIFFLIPFLVTVVTTYGGMCLIFRNILHILHKLIIRIILIISVGYTIHP